MHKRKAFPRLVLCPRRWLICKCSVFMLIFLMLYICCGTSMFDYVYEVAHGELPCFADENTKNSLKYMLFNFDQVMRQNNLSYWIDYGTLLGAYRNGLIIRYDHDGDVGYLYKDREIVLKRVAPSLRRRDIIVKDPHITVQLEYKGVKVDLFAYETYQNLHKDLPAGKTSTTLTRAYYRNSDFFEQTYSDTEYDWIFPVATCQLETMTLFCPNNPEKIFSVRYPYTYPYGIKLPFKFWCYANPKSFLKVLLF